MITNKELVDIYMAHRGLRRLRGSEKDFSPLLPFLMLDAQKSIYDRAIKPLECAHQQKLFRKRWNTAYCNFNKDFFRCYNRDQQDAIIEKMDDYEAYIQKDMTIAKISIMNCVKDESLERQEILADCMLCNILAQSAQLVWGRVYKRSRGKEEESPYIRDVQKWSYEFMNAYYGTNKPHINCNESKVVCNAVDILCQTMIKYLYKDDEH